MANPPLQRWACVLDALGDAAWLVAGDSLRVCAANPRALALLGRSQQDLLGSAAHSLMASLEDQAYWDEARQGRSSTLASQVAMLDPHGHLMHVERRIQPLQAGRGARSLHYLVTLRDRSTEQREQEAREQRLGDLQATLESTAEGILVTDLAGRIRVFNRRFAEIWGLPADLLDGRHDQAVFDWMRRSVTEPEPYERRLAAIAEATLQHARERLILHSGQVLERVSQPQCSQGRPVGRVWAFRDLSDMVQAQQRIQSLSNTDALTGLANRQQWARQLEQALIQARGQGPALALLILDLDRFRQVNDSLGPVRGDQVLLQARDRIQACLRQGDVLARLGGDQFALVLRDADEAAAEAVSKRLLAAVAQPLALDDMQFTLTCSIGVAVFPQHGQDGLSLEQHAEQAMRRAKRGGGADWQLHRARQTEDQRSRMAIDHAMRQALAAQQFRLHYQPQVDLQSGAVVGCEALIRWRDGAGLDIPPGRFIPVAEDTGFIIAIGDWVLAEGVRQAAQWRAQGMPVQVSLNVSALQFQQTGFVQRVADVLAQAQLPGQWLELELTESILVQDADEALQRLSTLSQMGVRLAIDDFGTGYSSLAYLKRFPIDRLKIDRSFVNGVPGDTSDVGIVRAIIQMSRALGMKVIAEGVETEPQRHFLRQAGCDQFQGWLFAKAMQPQAFEQRLRDSLLAPTQRLTLAAGH